MDILNLMKKKEQPKRTANVPRPEMDKKKFESMLKDAVKRSKGK